MFFIDPCKYVDLGLRLLSICFHRVEKIGTDLIKRLLLYNMAYNFSLISIFVHIHIKWYLSSTTCLLHILHNILYSKPDHAVHDKTTICLCCLFPSPFLQSGSSIDPFIQLSPFLNWLPGFLLLQNSLWHSYGDLLLYTRPYCVSR